jgi:hypothetical protein
MPLVVAAVGLVDDGDERWPIGRSSGDASDKGRGDRVDSGEGYCSGGKVMVTMSRERRRSWWWASGIALRISSFRNGEVSF